MTTAVYAPYYFTTEDLSDSEYEDEEGFRTDDGGCYGSSSDSDVEMDEPSSQPLRHRESAISLSASASLVPLTPLIRQSAWKQEYGRKLNAYTNATYRLPADEAEWERLGIQHQIFIELMGAKYPPPMGPILASTTPNEKRVLDLGCGNGAWIKDVARDFPFCEAVAVDLVPLEDSADFPPNLRSEVDNVNLGLNHYYNAFDVVHARLIASGIQKYDYLIEQMARILRPGGLVEIIEFDFTVYDCTGNVIQVDERSSTSSGGHIDAARHIRSWISNHIAFENVVSRDILLPNVPGDDTRFSPGFHEKMRENIQAFVKSSRPWLLSNGISEKLYDELASNVTVELYTSPAPQYVLLRTIYATKRHDVMLDYLE